MGGCKESVFKADFRRSPPTFIPVGSFGLLDCGECHRLLTWHSDELVGGGTGPTLLPARHGWGPGVLVSAAVFWACQWRLGVWGLRRAVAARVRGGGSLVSAVV